MSRNFFGNVGLLILSIFVNQLSFADFSVQCAEAPTNNLELTVSAIRSARQSILLNIYDLSSPVIADAIVAQVQAGIHVEIIEEGQPVGGMSAAAKGIETQIAQAMQQARNNDHMFIMASQAGGHRRFRYDHAKYAVIDGSSLLIGSENYSPTGNPSPGSVGNRGWEVIIHDAATAQAYQNIFLADSDTSKGDLTDLVRGPVMMMADGFFVSDDSLADMEPGRRPTAGASPRRPKPSEVPPATVPGDSWPTPSGGPAKPPRKRSGSHTPTPSLPEPTPPVPSPAPTPPSRRNPGAHRPLPAQPPEPIPAPMPDPIPAPSPQPISHRQPPRNAPSSLAGGVNLSASRAEVVTSPNTSLSGLEALINQANKSIDIEQMTFDSAWSGGTNPLVTAIQRAAQRGVHVRVLLNDEAVFQHGSTPSKPKNQPTVDLLTKSANVEARIANVKAMGVDYIHNKGALVDGRLTLISSINWDMNAISNNREAAVVLTSASIFQHYEALFESDWQRSGGQ